MTPAAPVAVAPATRAWLAVAALGAGLLHAALASGSPIPVAVVLIAVAAAELAWAVAAFVGDRPPFLRAALFLALLPVAGWAGLATVGATASGGVVLSLQPAPMAVASLLDVAVAATIAIVLRRNRPAPHDSGALRFVTVLALSAAAVSALTIPALGTTAAGGAAAEVHLLHSGHH